MSTALRLPRVRGPGLDWLPAFMHQRAYWRTVWRFVWLGPLVGGAPYVWTLVALPFAYFVGAVPALVAGMLFGAWYHGLPGRLPTWPWRAALGALSGLGATLLIALCQVVAVTPVSWVFVAIVAAHGVPAATVLALLQRPPQHSAAPR